MRILGNQVYLFVTNVAKEFVGGDMKMRHPNKVDRTLVHHTHLKKKQRPREYGELFVA